MRNRQIISDHNPFYLCKIIITYVSCCLQVRIAKQHIGHIAVLTFVALIVVMVLPVTRTITVRSKHFWLGSK